MDQLVAAPFSHDDMWYRARVTEVTLDDYDVEESLVTVYYLAMETRAIDERRTCVP